MIKLSRILSCLLALVLSIVFMAGCVTTPKDENIPFHIDVIPEQLKGNSIAGQHCVFLVTIADEGQTSEATVEISADAASAEIIIYKKAILEGQVAEVVVIPTQSSTGKSIEVTITGNRGGLTDEKVITFEVVEGEDDRQEYAVELKDKFVSWLESNHPELGITSDTEWTGTIVSPQWLVVSHYLFFSDEWEMHVEWHIMIAPYDWVRIDLRQRFDEQKPSYAFEISSLDANSEPKPIEVPNSVWR